MWLSTRIFSRLITAPTGADELISSLCREAGCYVWWDEVAEQIKLRAVRPDRDNVTALTDAAHIVRGSFDAEDLPDERVTRVFVRFARRDPTVSLGEKANQSEGVLYVDADAEGSDEFGDTRVLEINAQWLAAGNRAIAVELAARLLARYGTIARRARWALDAKDQALRTAGLCTIQHHRIQDPTGAAPATQFQVLEVAETQDGRYEYLAQEDFFVNRYGFIGPDTLPDYSSATTADKERYAWIAQNTGDFADGSDAYRII